MRFLITSHINILKFIFKLIEVDKSKVNFEYAKFDTQLLSNTKSISNSGVNSYYNLKAFILARDKYTCQKCKAVEVPLRVHHIKFRSNGGTDRPSNLVTVCTNCHTKIHSNTISNKFTLNSNSL